MTFYIWHSLLCSKMNIKQSFRFRKTLFSKDVKFGQCLYLATPFVIRMCRTNRTASLMHLLDFRNILTLLLWLSLINKCNIIYCLTKHGNQPTMLSYYNLATQFYIITKYEYCIITAGIKIVQILRFYYDGL